MRKIVLSLFVLPLMILISGNSSARGWHSNSRPPDWLVIFIFAIIVLVFLLGLASAAFKYWKESKYLKSGIYLVICISLSRFALSWINWREVLGWTGAVGLMGLTWFMIGLCLLIIGFIFKNFVGVYFKSVRSMSTEEFLLALGSLTGLVLGSVLYFCIFVSVFIGVPVIIIMKLIN